MWRVPGSVIAVCTCLLGVTGCGTLPSGQVPVQFTGRMLIAVPEDQGRSIAQVRGNPSEASAAGSQWRFDAVKVTRRDDRGPASGPARTWIVASPARSEAQAKDDANPWDSSHKILDGAPPARYRSMLTELSRAAGSEVKPLAVEPDLIYADKRRPASLDRQEQEVFRSHTQGNELSLCAGESCHWPSGKDMDWHMGDRYSQLKSAREFVRNRYPPKAPSKRIKVAVIDTGYNEDHVANPPGLDKSASRDFSRDPVNPSVGAADPFHTGPMKNPGHGCGVISILAGNRVQYSEEKFSDYLGGAPDVDVVVFRISDSVVHLSPVSMAFAIKYATETGCDVISISHGGLPCQLLADAVNEAYENGTAIFAAAGDFFALPFLGISSPQSTVYPAAFERVVSVCGVTANGTTYSRAPTWLTLLTFKDWAHWMLRGSYGPDSLMDKAIAAYSPNVAWARYAKDNPENLFDLNGSGTSAATPQVSAAAALWLQAHRDDPALAGAKWRSWEKVEAVYWALFDSAEKKTPEGGASFTYFGNGLLKARRALDLGVPANMRKRPEAKIGLGWLRLWAGFLVGVRDAAGAQPDARQALHAQMIETELAQLIHGSVELQTMIANFKIDTLRDKTPPESLKLFLLTASREKQCSLVLRKALQQRAAQL